MKITGFSNRVTKEIIRDPLSLFFGIGFPIVLLLLLFTIGRNIPNHLFNIEILTPGIAVFSLSFLSLFGAQILAKDRSSSFLVRLFTTPMTARDFILGYSLPLLVMSILQGAVLYGVAMILELTATTSIFFSIITLIPTSILFISIGLLSGVLLSEKAAVGINGALLTNLTAWLSGAWIDLDLIGGIFKEVALILPFVHAVEMTKSVLMGQYSHTFSHFCWVFSYAIFLFIITITIFKKKMQQK